MHIKNIMAQSLSLACLLLQGCLLFNLGVLVLSTPGGSRLSEIPEGWFCPPNFYNQGDGICDCDCGAYDPDCDDANTIDGCLNDDAVCSLDGQCIIWNCNISNYDNSDGCHCGCGSYDPDCSTESEEVIGCEDTSASVQCLANGECGRWTCDDIFYNNSDGCHCGCGIYDPDCDNVEGQIPGCGMGQICTKISAECGRIIGELEIPMNTSIIHIQKHSRPIKFPSKLFQFEQLRSVIIEDSAIYGQIPMDIGRVSNLETFSLYFTDISGTIPSQIGHLSKLKVLDIGYNSRVVNGTLPSEIGNCGNLETLYITDTQINGSIPSELSKLTKLTALSLVANALHGEIPSELGQHLPLLEELSLWENKLTGTIPSSLGNLREMKYFELYENELNGTIPSQLGLLNKSISFILRENALYGSIPSQIGLLSKVEFLTLHTNQLNGTIPTEIYSLTQLSYLDFSFNELSGSLSRELTNLVNNDNGLNDIRIGGNRFTVECDCRLLSWFPEFVRDVGGVDVIDVFSQNTCSDANEYFGSYPHTIQIEDGAPCSHATYSDYNTSASSITTSWIYNFSTYFAAENITEQLEAFYHDSRKNELINISDCSPVLPPSEFLENNTLGFEMVVEKEGKIIQRKCYFASSREIRPKNFEFVSDNLEAFTEYEISVRSFFIYFPISRRDRTEGLISDWSRYVFGPRSKAIKVRTASTTSESPVDITFSHIGAREFEVGWKQPEKLNGKLKFYQVELWQAGKLILSDNSNFQLHRFRSEKIIPNSIYLVRVRAFTSGGFGNWSDLNTNLVRTCPDNTRRSIDEQDCNAVLGYFKAKDNLVQECASVIGIEADACLRNNVDVKSLVLKKGFWRAGLQTSDIRQCPAPEYCLQQNTKGESYNVTNTDHYCTQHHVGVYCMSCEEGYVLKENGCELCDEETTDREEVYFYLFVILLLLVALAPLLLFIFRLGILTLKRCKKKQQQVETDKQEGIFTLLWENGHVFSNKLRIAIGFFQVYAEFRRSSQKGQVSASSDLAMSTLGGNMVALMEGFSFKCSFEYNFYDTLLFYTLYPLGLVLFVFLSSKILLMIFGEERVNRLLLKNMTFGTCLEIFFIVYPSVSLNILKTFFCESFDDSAGVTYKRLRSDYTITCDMTTERKGFLVYASIMVLIYPVGILALYIVLLNRYRPNQSTDVSSERRNRIKLLTKPYNDSGFWFEAYELFRKLVQIGAVAAATATSIQGSNENSDNYTVIGLLAVNLTILPCLILVLANPYKYATDFYYALASLILLIPSAELIIVDDVDEEFLQNGNITLLTLNMIVLASSIIVDIWIMYHYSISGIQNDNSNSSSTLIKSRKNDKGSSGMAFSQDDNYNMSKEPEADDQLNELGLTNTESMTYQVEEAIKMIEKLKVELQEKEAKIRDLTNYR